MVTLSLTDDSHNYFLSKAQDLLHKIEQDLLNLREDRTLVKVRRLMRAAHTLKGSAAIVERKAIGRVAHVLEDIFTALYNTNIVVDVDVESLLLQGYECLKRLLKAELSGKPVNETDVLNRVASMFTQLQEKLGDSFNHNTPLPTSTDLGFDMVQSMFEVEVAQQLDRLRQSLATVSPEILITEFQSEVEFFLGLAECLDLPGFEAIAQTTLKALAINPSQVVTIAELALDDFTQGYAAVLAGDRTQAGSPSSALQDLARVPATASQPEITRVSTPPPAVGGGQRNGINNQARVG